MIFNTYIWAKFFIEIICLLYIFTIFRQKRIKALNFFILIVVLYLIRDIIFEFYANNEIILCSEILILLIYLFWIRTFSGIKKIDYFFIPFNISLFIFSISNLFFNLIDNNLLILTIILLLNILYIFLVMSQFTIYNIKNPELILSLKVYILVNYLILYFFLFFYIKHIVFIHYIVIPASYFLILYILNRYNNTIIKEKNDQLAHHLSDLESLFTFINNFSTVISNKQDLDNALNFIINSAVKNSNAEAGTILLVDDYKDELNVKAVAGLYPPIYNVSEKVKSKSNTLLTYFKNTPIKFGETLFGEAVKSGKSIFIRDIKEDDRLEYNKSDDLLFISSLIIIPLIVSERVIGLISTIKRTDSNLFEDKDYNHLETFASYVSISIDNMRTYIEILEKKELQKELFIAANIQQRLLPKKIPFIKNLSIGVHSKPAKGVSGDYYDIIKINDDITALIICDVAGKGVPAAMVMVMIRSMLHLIINSNNQPASILNWINQGLHGDVDVESFATMSILLVNNSEKKIIYSNAAHLPLIYYNKNKDSFFKIDTQGIPLGIEKKTKYSQKTMHVESGDLFILYTDGIIEAMDKNGNQYTKETLLKLLNKNRQLKPSQIVDEIDNDIKKFVGTNKQHDDQTLLLLKLN